MFGTIAAEIEEDPLRAPHRTCTVRLCRGLCAWLLLSAGALPARGAGGHHDVDDATMLAPGHCQVEVWAIVARTPRADDEHVGPACNWAGVEWGLNVDRLRVEGTPADNYGPQAKWVTELLPGRFAAGAVVSLTWRRQAPGEPLAGLLVPATLWLGPGGQLQVHFNVGRDHDPGVGGQRRWGIAADWTPREWLTLTAERRLYLGQTLSRVGARWNVTPLVSVDASVARSGDAHLYAIGLSWEWER
jgi:hypothetical protein